MAKFKGAKPGDVIKIETKSESGYVLIVGVHDDGLAYIPVPQNFQRRENRPPVKAHEIKEVFRKLKV